eukprot:SAG22_NODE_276_length_13167_cov_8.415825_2_plen_88_part_00
MPDAKQLAAHRVRARLATPEGRREWRRSAVPTPLPANQKKRKQLTPGERLRRDKVSCKALSFCCASTVVLAKTVPFRAVCPARQAPG